MFLSRSIWNLYTSFAKSRFTLIEMGIIEQRSKKYLKKRIKFSPEDPEYPFKVRRRVERMTMTTNKILLKKFNSLSRSPNLFPVSLIFNVNLVFLPVYKTISNAFPEAILTPLQAVFSSPRPKL